MQEHTLDRNSSIVTMLTFVMILYGSLYPFAFRTPIDGIGPVATLLGSWADTPGRGDFLSNILLYMPLGFFARHALHRDVRAWGQTALVVLLGAALSASVELTQYYDEGRQTAATDFYSNTLGTLLGAVGARAIGTDLIRWSLARGKDNRVPLMLLATWLGYCLFPYVPTIDLHKYWNALKPVVLHPSLTVAEMFHQTITWLTVGILIEYVFGHRKSLAVFPVFFVFILVSKVLIIDTTLSVGEIAGGTLAVCLWYGLAIDAKMRLAVIAALMCFAVPIERLQPFDFEPQLRAFGWIPFYSFMHGSINIDTMSFFEKFFAYGSLIWILAESGVRVRSATLLVAVTLFVTSAIEIYLPDRSAEITDTLMALMIGGVIGLIRATWSSALKPSVPADLRSNGIKPTRVYAGGTTIQPGTTGREERATRRRPRPMYASALSSQRRTDEASRAILRARREQAAAARTDENQLIDASAQPEKTQEVERLHRPPLLRHA